MKLYFYVGYVRTGGPEAYHQYCDMSRMLGYDAYMFYHDAPSNDAPCLYTEKYVNLVRATTIEDSPSNALFIPEIFSIRHVLSQLGLKNVRVVLTWLSFDLGASIAEHNLSFEGTTAGAAIHTFQSAYARDMVGRIVARMSGLTCPPMFNLGDYIHDSYVLQGWDKESKKAMVAYNPRKDGITQRVCEGNNIPCIAIQNMSYDTVIQSLKACKVYVDCGSHPGMDRIPREAASLGCVVITNRCGSARYYDDVPISLKCDTITELGVHLNYALNHYEEALDSQDKYRKMIHKQKLLLARQVQALCKHLLSPETFPPFATGMVS